MHHKADTDDIDNALQRVKMSANCVLPSKTEKNGEQHHEAERETSEQANTHHHQHAFTVSHRLALPTLFLLIPSRG